MRPAGRGYAVAGGVAEAVTNCIHEFYPEVTVQIEHAEGLAECKKVLTLAKAGKKNGCIIEGMGCPGGCIAGQDHLRFDITNLNGISDRDDIKFSITNMNGLTV